MSQEHQNREYARVESEAKAQEDSVRKELQMKTSEVALSKQSLARGKTTTCWNTGSSRFAWAVICAAAEWASEFWIHVGSSTRRTSGAAATIAEIGCHDIYQFVRSGRSCGDWAKIFGCTCCILGRCQGSMTLVFTSYCKITSSSSDACFCEYLLERCSGFLASSLVIQGYAELQLAHQKMKDELVSQEHQNREWARVESEAKAREDTVRTELQMKTSEVASANRALQEQNNRIIQSLKHHPPASVFQRQCFPGNKGSWDCKSRSRNGGFAPCSRLPRFPGVTQIWRFGISRSTWERFEGHHGSPETPRHGESHPACVACVTCVASSFHTAFGGSTARGCCEVAGSSGCASGQGSIPDKPTTKDKMEQAGDLDTTVIM